jgi:hypothetical protein
MESKATKLLLPNLLKILAPYHVPLREDLCVGYLPLHLR